MTRALIIIALLVSLAAAAFTGSAPSRKVSSTAASASDTLKTPGSQVMINVAGSSSLTGAFVTISATFPCTAKRDTSSAANASFFVPRGVPVVRARIGSGVNCIAATTADSGVAAAVRFEAGSGAP